MKISFFSITLVTLLSACYADIPSKVPLSKYSSLWNDSPITEKPDPVVQVQTSNPLDDYSLTGVAPIKGGYIITIINKNDRTKKKTINSTKPENIKVVSVNRTPGKSFSTSVTLETATGAQGTVMFERDIIKPMTQQGAPNNRVNNPPNGGAANQSNNATVNPAQAPANGAGQTIVNGAAQVTPAQGPIRAPRPRIVPRSTNATGNPNAPQGQDTNNNGNKSNSNRDRVNRR